MQNFIKMLVITNCYYMFSLFFFFFGLWSIISSTPCLPPPSALLCASGETKTKPKQNMIPLLGSHEILSCPLSFFFLVVRLEFPIVKLKFNA